jgi:SAM-dependent methyltransferase
MSNRWPLIPWRVKNLVSERLPLAYHLIANRGIEGNSKAHWDHRLAETWDSPTRHWPAKIQAIAATLDRQTSIIDIGCGNGSILRGLRLRGFERLHGLELSKYAVRRLSGQGIGMSQGDLLDMPFADGRFEAAIASEVLEHVIRRRRFLRELIRVVKPAGKVLIFVPDDTLGPIDEPEHVMKYNATSLRRFLQRFTDVESVGSILEPHNGARCLFAVCRTRTPRAS